MRQIRDEIEIDAPPQRVWEVLTDTSSFRSWNPTIRSLDGPLEPGERIRVTLALGGRLYRFRPVVSVVRPPHELRWVLSQPVFGVFKVERAFELEALGTAGTHFRQSEVARGLFATPIMAAIGGQIAHGYAEMNRALKERAEQEVHS